MVELSNVDVTSGLARLLAAEINKLPFFDSDRMSYITRERYTIDPKYVLNTSRKPWLLSCLVMSNPVSSAPYQTKSRFPAIDHRKSECNYRMVHAGIVVPMKHYLETVVELSNGGVTSGSRRPLAAENDKLLSVTDEVMHITCGRYCIIHFR
jgi:hypothetical protein